jgi:hypothetical protein
MFECVLGECRSEVFPVLMLCSSEFAINSSLLLDTNVSEDNVARGSSPLQRDGPQRRFPLATTTSGCWAERDWTRSWRGVA